MSSIEQTSSVSSPAPATGSIAPTPHRNVAMWLFFVAAMVFIMVVIGGLTFNVVPFANTQNSVRRVIRVMAIVLAILLIAVGIAIGFVYLLLT